jgi:uncharacterized membrane protein YkvA (DUF1232 family)
MTKKVRLTEEEVNLPNATKGGLFKDDEDKKSKSLFHRIFVKRAYALMRRPLTVFRLLKRAGKYIKRYDSLAEFTADVKTNFERLVRLVRAYTKGEYRGISAGNIALSIAAILYVVSPIDFIPDFIAGGMLDDIAILTWLYNNVETEIEEFLQWEEEHKLVQVPVDPIDEDPTS